MVLRCVQILPPCGASKKNVPIEAFNISFESMQNRQQYGLYLHRGKKKNEGGLDLKAMKL